MADLLNGKKRIAPSTIVAIIAVCVTVILGGITIWQASYFYSQQSREQERKEILDKIDGLTASVQDVKITIAQIGQRLEDHINGSRP